MTRDRPLTDYQTDPAQMDRLRARYLELTEDVLPRLARREGWPITEDHCYQRVILDTIAGQEWYHTIADPTADAPAFMQLDAEQLQAAINVAHQMIEHGRPVVERLNDRSLSFRT